MPTARSLAFAHDREMFDERDIPLIDLVLLLAEQRVRQNVPAFALKGSLLDQAMRVLLGREVELKKDGEDPVRVPVRTGEITPAVSLETSDGGAKLRVKTPDVTLGLSGAYEFLPTGVVCAYGADFRRVEALLRAAAERPNGLPLEEKADCARLCAGHRALPRAGDSGAQNRAAPHADGDDRPVLSGCGREGRAALPPGVALRRGACASRRGDTRTSDGMRSGKIRRLRGFGRSFPSSEPKGEYAFDGDDDERATRC